MSKYKWFLGAGLVIVVGVCLVIIVNRDQNRPELQPVAENNNKTEIISEEIKTVIDEVNEIINSTTNDGAVENSVGLANPASVNCVDKGGELKIMTSTLGEYGVCFFEDNHQCEEWSMMRGECPVGGLKVAGYENEAEVYCVITGGKTEAGGETCTFANGQVCDLIEYYKGKCGRAE